MKIVKISKSNLDSVFNYIDKEAILDGESTWQDVEEIEPKQDSFIGKLRGGLITYDEAEAFIADLVSKIRDKKEGFTRWVQSPEEKEILSREIMDHIQYALEVQKALDLAGFDPMETEGLRRYFDHIEE